MNTLNAEIITVGTELLLGQILNTNAQYLSQKLAELGINCFFQTTVGDNQNRIIEVIKTAKKRANLLIFTGGIGPTQDDMTKEALASFLNEKLIMHTPSLRKIEEVFKKKNVQMSENNRRQALTFENGEVLQNLHGQAIGNIFKDKDNTLYVILPGPPDEMIPMFQNEVLPWLQKYQNGSLYSIMLKFAGIRESLLENKLLDLITSQQKITLAPYAKQSEVSLRLSVKAKCKEEAVEFFEPFVQTIEKRLGKHLYAYEDIPIEAAVVEQLKRRQWSLSSAESCTGGLFGELITNIPGSGQIYKGGVTCYCNEVKNKLLNVPEMVLKEKGAVSAETARYLAENVRKIMKTTIGASFTGVAGPGETENKPIGLVYMGLSHESGQTLVTKFNFSGTRDSIRLQSVKALLYELYGWVKDGNVCSKNAWQMRPKDVK